MSPFARTRTTTTDRQTLGVIDWFSASFEEHFADCSIIVIDVLEEPLLWEPLLGQGLYVGLDTSLREELVLGLITCVGEGLVS